MFASSSIISKTPAPHLFRFITVIFVLLPFFSAAQIKPKTDSILYVTKIKDTVLKNTGRETLKKDDSSVQLHLSDKLGIRISKDALEDVVVATATDSALMDLKTNNFSLYGDAKVTYDGRKLNADQIVFNQASNIATASEVKDTTTKKSTPPTFEQGSEKFTYEHLQYNFKTQRAIVRNARSQYGEGFVHSEQIKRNNDKSLYGYKNVYTTCALDHPHFGIRTNRIKIIPEQAIATGSANIEIEGVPTPLFLPFGYFPVNNEKHRSGFVLPTYTTEINRGLGLLRGGYYFHLNDYVDLLLQTDVYTKGSVAGYMTSNYANRYRYNGNVFFSYSLNKTGEDFDPAATNTKDFAFRWAHYKDAKSLPGVNFNANVNVNTGSFYTNNSYNPGQITQNQFSSNITFTKNWVGKPYSFTASATHNQNIITKEVIVNLPNITFNLVPQNVLQRKNPVGATRWYEKISVGYTMNTMNRLTFYDTALKLNELQMSDFRNGMSHVIPITAYYNVLRFITLNFNATYNEYWNTQRMYRAYNDLSQKIDTSINNGFAASRDFNTGISMNTNIYGMKLFKKGVIRGLRHKLSPSIGFNYRPDFAKDPFNYYYEARLDTSQKLNLLSPYEQSIIGRPPSGRNGSINFALNNNLQMKVRNGKDTAKGFKNIPLIDRLDFNTSYNLAADSFQWSNYVFSAATNIANLVNITANATFDPYQWDYVANRRTPRTTLAAGNGWARLTSASLGFSTSLHSKQKSNKNEDAKNSEDYKNLMRNNGYSNYVDFNIPWTLNLSYTFDLTRQASVYSKSDSSIINQSVMMNGDFNITPRLKVGFNTGYNIVLKQMAYTQINIYRDLHCWEMRLGLAPFGVNRNFNFTLSVKAQVLQDLKLTRRRDFRDAVN